VILRVSATPIILTRGYLTKYHLHTLVFTSIGLGMLSFIIVLLIQRFVAGDGWGAAVAKGMAMGVVAGVPYPVVGPVVGSPLLAWSGIRAPDQNTGLATRLNK
jgi:hypothetical protein